MQPTFDADDFMKRGILGSIIGFRKRSSSKSEVSEIPSTSVSTHPHHQRPIHRTAPEILSNVTEYDIYREIVSEAEKIERSSTTSPDIPTPIYAFPVEDAQKIDNPSYYQMMMTSEAPHPIPVDQNGIPIQTQCPMAPPPYAEANKYPLAPVPFNAANIPLEVSKEIHDHYNFQTPVSIEDIVKLVVNALKDSQIEEVKEEESPEEILRRKRLQNNLAAARYRKRQRQARDSAEKELNELTKRNEELRQMVARMEAEIANIKKAVLRD